MSLFDQSVLDDAQNQLEENVTNVQNAIVGELGTPLHINDITWEAFCENLNLDNGSVSVVDLSNISPPIHSSNILLKETISHNSNSRIVITNSHFMIPKLENRIGIRIITMTSRKLNEKGVMIDQWIDDPDNADGGGSGILTFIPFVTGKKVFGFYQKEDYIKKFFNVGSCKPIDPIHNVTIPEGGASINDELTDENKVIIANSSAKLRNLVDDWDTVRDLHSFINTQIFETIDPSYLLKLFNLSKSIIFPI